MLLLTVERCRGLSMEGTLLGVRLVSGATVRLYLQDGVAAVIVFRLPSAQAEFLRSLVCYLNRKLHGFRSYMWA